MNKCTLTIVIPTLNEELYLPLLLSDLEKQSNNDFAIIIVDAVSQDTTIKKCKDFSKTLNISIIEVEKQNVSFQKNTGAQKATSSHIIFLDADMRVKKTFISRVQKALNKDHTLHLLPHVVPIEKTNVDMTIFQLSNHLIELSQFIGRPLPSSGCMIFERNYFNFIGGFDEKIIDKAGIGEDHEIMLKSRKAGVIARCDRSIEVQFSMRRLQKEGRMAFVRKYITSGLEIARKGRLDKPLFEYKMGGHYFSDIGSPSGKRITLRERIRNLEIIAEKVLKEL